jgi:hypothetical protein
MAPALLLRTYDCPTDRKRNDSVTLSITLRVVLTFIPLNGRQIFQKVMTKMPLGSALSVNYDSADETFLSVCYREVCMPGQLVTIESEV